MFGPFARLLGVSLLAGSLALAQPVLAPGNPAVNAASYRIPGSSGAGVAQGSIFAVFGAGLGPVAWVSANTFPLQTELAETSVRITVGGTSTDALILFTSGWQVNAVLPSNTPVGNGTITVTYQHRTSAPAPIQVVSGAFGIFTFSAAGDGQAIVQNVSQSSQQNTIIKALHPGEWGSLWGTGLGAITASDATAPPVGSLPNAVTVYVGNAAATVDYHGRAGCCSGLDQINFKVPDGIQGCHVPIAVQTGGTLSNIATVAVAPAGRDTCTDSIMGQDLVDKLASGQTVNFGHIWLENSNSTFQAGTANRNNTDVGAATFSRYTPATAGYAQYGVSSGYCVALDCSNNCIFRGFGLTLFDSSPSQLDAGSSLSVFGQGPRTLEKVFNGYYAALFNPTGRFLWSDANYSVSGTGGVNVGAFSVSERSTIPSAQITNLTRGQTVSRTSDLTVNWRDADPNLQGGHVTIGGFSASDPNGTQFALYQCVAPATAGTFTIPGWILGTLPHSGEIQQGTLVFPLGSVWIGQTSNPITFQAEGLDRGILTDIFFNGVGVYFQ